MQIDLNPSSMKPGDVVLVYSTSKRARLNLVGQSVLRLVPLLLRRSQAPRYSHVMLGVLPGVVIHSDGKSVKTQRLTDAIGGNRIERDQFRVLRPVGIEIENGPGNIILLEAQRFLKQKYSFIPGRRTTLIGRVMHGRRPLTHPFCSELVAATYKAIGRPISRLPPDRTLPVDLESCCVAPSWIDVSETFVKDKLAFALSDERFQVGDRQLTIPEFFEETDRLLSESWRLDVEQTYLVQDVITSSVFMFGLAQQLRVAEMSFSKSLAITPQLLFGEYESLTRRDLESLPDFYRQLRHNSTAETGTFSVPLGQLFPNVASNRNVYESIPSADTLALMESMGTSLEFGARALRLEAELCGIAIGLGCPIDGKNRFEGFSKDLVAAFVDTLFALAESDASVLIQSVETLSMPDAADLTGTSSSTDSAVDVATTEYTNQVRKACRTIVNLHRLLSLLLSDYWQAKNLVPSDNSS